MKLEPVLRAHAFMKTEQPPEIWEADTDDTHFFHLLGEMIAAALSQGTPLGELVLSASNVVLGPSDDDEGAGLAPPGEYVAVTVRGRADFGPDARWTPSAPAGHGMLSRLHQRLEAAGASFAYIRGTTPEASCTVVFPRAK